MSHLRYLVTLRWLTDQINPKKVCDFSIFLSSNFRPPYVWSIRATKISRVRIIASLSHRIKYNLYLNKANSLFYSSLVLQTVGLALLGIACSVIFVPLLSEIIEGVQEKEGITEMGELNDKAAGVFNTSYAIGCIIAPILGGYLNIYTDFRTTSDIMALSSAVYGTLYFCVAILPGCCCDKEQSGGQISVTNTPSY
jgi:MFS family permease